MRFNDDDTKTLLQLMTWRRDVRHFKTDALPEKAIETMRQAMELAPSVGNSRPWRIITVKSKATRSKVIANFEQSNHEAAGLYADEKREQYIRLKLAGLREAPLHLAVFTDLSPAEGAGLGRQTMPETLVYSTITAIHQLWLVARTMNIGVGWVSILESEKMNAMLDIPAEWKFTAYLCIGYPQEDHDTPELERVGWQENTASDWLER